MADLDNNDIVNFSSVRLPIQKTLIWPITRRIRRHCICVFFGLSITNYGRQVDN